MGKVVAILTAVAAAAGGATYAFFTYADPYRCASSCEVARQRCCAVPTVAECPASPDAGVAAAGPIAMFTDSTVAADAHACCAVPAATAARVACCESTGVCCVPATACCAGNGALAAVVGPAAVR